MAETLTYTPEQTPQKWDIYDFVEKLNLLDGSNVKMLPVLAKHPFGHGHYLPHKQDEPVELETKAAEEIASKSLLPLVELTALYVPYFKTLGMEGGSIMAAHPDPEDNPEAKFQIIFYPDKDTTITPELAVKHLAWLDGAVTPMVVSDDEDYLIGNEPILINATRNDDNTHRIDVIRGKFVDTSEGMNGIERVEDLIRLRGGHLELTAVDQEFIEDLLAARV